MVKKILDGANLEEVTMKSVCRQVYESYPDFDLTHKKLFIKETVKSVSFLYGIQYFADCNGCYCLEIFMKVGDPCAWVTQ